MADTISGEYNRFDPKKNYESLVFRAGKVLQSAELNEVQSTAAYRHKMLGDALFKDGDIVRDAQVFLDPDTGNAVCGSGAVYLRGMVRGVPAGNITIPLQGTVAIGIWLNSKIITVVEDPDLREPAVETRNYQEEGAARRQVDPKWGYATDGSEGEFFPIYFADDGVMRAKEAPPALDSVSQAIARYDRDSNGSNYAVSGLTVSKLPDMENGSQVYNVDAGRARINGLAVTLATSRRVIYPATPELRFIDSEPHSSTTVGAQRVTLDRSPIANITAVRIQAVKTVTLVHGSFSGARDPLPDTSVVKINSVIQGATTYTQGTDYILAGGGVDWSPSGAEPGAGQSYQVTYEYITAATPTAVDNTGFTVTGAVVGTLILTSYNVKLPRIDRLCIDETGQTVWLPGISTDYNPVRPQVPANLLALCQVLQTWGDDRAVTNDGVHMVSMATIEGMNYRLDQLTDMIAQQNLKSDAATRETAAMKGLFVDPFINDDQRDQGVAQTAAIVNGALTLAIAGDAKAVSSDVTSAQTCPFTLETVLEQTLRTGSMNINPYMAFDPIPAKITLTPAVDRWTVAQSSFASAVTQNFTSYAVSGRARGAVLSQTSSTSTALVSSTTTQIENLRQIPVNFEATGFGPNEALSSVTFDGIVVTATAQ